MQPDKTRLSPGDEAPPDVPGVSEDVCSVCKGRGSVEGQRCSICNGTGKILQGVGSG